MPVAIAKENGREYPFRVLTGKEQLEFRSHRKRIPVSLMLVPLRHGSPIFIQGLRKSTAHYLKKRLAGLIGSPIDAIHVVVDGIDGYTFSIHTDLVDVMDA
jgi:hypothetical protein